MLEPQFLGCLTCKGFGPTICPSWAFQCQRLFFFILTHIFRFGYFSGYHTQTFGKYKFDCPMHNLIKFRFSVFTGQFKTVGNCITRPPEAEKLVASGEKKSSKYLQIFIYASHIIQFFHANAGSFLIKLILWKSMVKINKYKMNQVINNF